MDHDADADMNRQPERYRFSRGVGALAFADRLTDRSALTAAFLAFLSSFPSPFGLATVTLGVSVSVSDPESSESSSSLPPLPDTDAGIGAGTVGFPFTIPARALAAAAFRERIMPGWFSVLVYVAMDQLRSPIV